MITYRSKDLKDWQYLGAITKAKALATEGYMWECPDFFELAGKDVLLLSPQGIKLMGKNTLIYSKQVILSENMTIKKISLVMDHSPNLITDMIFMRLKRCLPQMAGA